MKHFWQAIRLSFKYKWSIIGSVISSLVIACLFCISITTVFPVVKIVLEGETAPIWIANEIATAQADQDRMATEIADLERQIQRLPAGPSKERDDGMNQIQQRRKRVKAESKALAWYQWVQPAVDLYAPQDPFPTLVLAMLFLLLTAILKGAVLVLSAVLVSRVSNRTVLDLRRIYYRKALELEQAKVEQLGTSVMMTHLSQNMQMISAGLRALYGKSLREPFKMVACLIGAAMISLPLLLISLVVIPAGALVIQNLSRRMKKSMQAELGGMATVYQTLMETLSWLKTVRIFNREGTERIRFKKSAEVLYRMSMRISFYDSLLRPISEVLGIIAIALSILAGSYLVLNQTTFLFGWQILERPMKPSMLVLFYTMLAGASDPARKMSEIINILVRADTAVQNLYTAYDISVKVPKSDARLPVPQLHRSLEFRRVTFAYQKNQPIIKSLNLKIPAGQTIAIVGANGSGKTTLMNLLVRFYEPQQGTILLDDQDIALMNPKRLRRQIAWVTQEAVLFRGTLAENIGYGWKRASQSDILEAARAAHVTDFLPQLDQGLDTQIGDNGLRLSAGQRQRLALARAILADPRILILDEATSHLDGSTQRLIHESLRRFIKDRTTFIISHQRSSLELADRIIVLENGQIVADDTLDNTSSTSAQFQRLFSKSA